MLRFFIFRRRMLINMEAIAALFHHRSLNQFSHVFYSIVFSVSNEVEQDLLLFLFTASLLGY